MHDLPSGRIGVLIVRLWIEPNHETGLRARITQTVDTRVTGQSVAVAASVDDVCAAVKQWVDAFADPRADRHRASRRNMTPTRGRSSAG
jgi:hypothetical protein